MNSVGTLTASFITACDLENGIDGREIFGTTLNMISKFGENVADLQEWREIAEQEIPEVISDMFTSKDINEQLIATLVYTDLVSGKVEKNVRQEVANNYIGKLKKIEKAYEDACDQLDTQKAITDKAIKNEIAAKEELSRVKRRTDKQQRVAEHKIAELEKEIEMLKAQLNK